MFSEENTMKAITLPLAAACILCAGLSLALITINSGTVAICLGIIALVSTCEGVALVGVHGQK
jgi:hypothetical protein